MQRGLVVPALALAVLVGCRPGIGEDAGVAVAGADHIEIREVPPGAFFPGEGTDEVGAVHATLRHPDDVEPLVDALDGAAYIDLGRVVYDLVEPDYEVVFFDGDAVLARLGYYEDVYRWGEWRVQGRWLKGGDPLAVTEPLPAEALR